MQAAPQSHDGCWRVDETYVKVKGTWIYLYRAVDSQGKTLGFLLSVPRDAEAAKRFFSKALIASHTVMPRVITIDKNAAYPKAVSELKAAATLPEHCGLWQVKYLTTSSSKTIVLSNDSSNQGWASFPLRAHGERYKGTKA